MARSRKTETKKVAKLSRATTRLGDEAMRRRLDPERMLARIQDLPRQCRDAWRTAQAFNLPESYRDARQIVLLGLGGSAIGGDLVRTLVQDECPIPITVVRDYDLPAHVNERTLVIASSYSGDTEETLSAFEQAAARDALRLALTTGGNLAARARALGVPLFTFDYPAQPRAALGYSLVPLLAILARLGFIADVGSALEEALAQIEAERAALAPESPTGSNVAKQLALKLRGRLPVVYGAQHLSEVARRWKGQFNENAKAWGFYEVMPELSHNAVVGYEFPAEPRERIAVLMLTSSLYHRRVQARFQVTAEILSQRGISWEKIEARGNTLLAQMLSTIYLGDHVSYYLALLYGVDPTPVETIKYLKERLAEVK